MMYKNFKDLPPKARTIYKIFNKSELLEICGELELEAGRSNTRQIVLMILNDLEETGIPSPDDQSDSLFEFLLNINFIDEDGTLLDRTAEVDIQDEEISVFVDYVDGEGEEIEKPECFTRAEIRDPSCRRCVIYSQCMEARIEVRPHCFGKEFSANADECKACFEITACREEMKNRLEV